MAAPKISRTLGPIHFEDLDPKRFEDLVRQLIYDFKDWQNIEATGRAGMDDGFDIRAYEKTSLTPAEAEAEIEEDGSEFAVGSREGHQWMVQCKREKQIGPTRIVEIIKECIDPKNPPYGYILVAPANFSKKCFDSFRSNLRDMGIYEFHLWGRAALEDMLFQPKNDHVLFAYFGVSLGSRRRSRSTDIRFRISIKNKLIKLLGEHPRNVRVLVRDVDDESYPHADINISREGYPAWKDYAVLEFDHAGLVVEASKYFAYFDHEALEWDAYKAMDISHRSGFRVNGGPGYTNLEAFSEGLPSPSQVKLVRKGLIKFESIVVIDPLGDSAFKMPHLFTMHSSDRGPFFGFIEQLEVHQGDFTDTDNLKRCQIFPENIPAPPPTVIRKEVEFEIDSLTGSNLRGGRRASVYSLDQSLQDVGVGNIITVVIKGARDQTRELAKITNVRIKTYSALLSASKGSIGMQQAIQAQLSEEVGGDDLITVRDIKLVADENEDEMNL